MLALPEYISLDIAMRPLINNLILFPLGKVFFMATDRELAPFKPYFIEVSPEQEKALIGACTDERGMEGVQYAVQYAGGSYGTAQNLHTAQAIRGEALTQTNLALDTRNTQALIAGSTHIGCAAMASAAAIDKLYRDHPDDVLRQAEGLMPGLIEEEDLAAAIRAADFREEYGMYLPVDSIVKTTSNENLTVGEHVPHLALHHDVPHAADVMIANDIAGEYADTAAMFEAGVPAYGFTVHRLGDIALRLDTLYPGASRDDSFMKAAALHQAAVSLAVPNSTGKPGVKVLYRGSNFAKVA